MKVKNDKLDKLINELKIESVNFSQNGNNNLCLFLKSKYENKIRTIDMEGVRNGDDVIDRLEKEYSLYLRKSKIENIMKKMNE